MELQRKTTFWSLCQPAGRRVARRVVDSGQISVEWAVVTLETQCAHILLDTLRCCSNQVFLKLSRKASLRRWPLSRNLTTSFHSFFFFSFDRWGNGGTQRENDLLKATQEEEREMKEGQNLGLRAPTHHFSKDWARSQTSGQESRPGEEAPRSSVWNPFAPASNVFPGRSGRPWPYPSLSHPHPSTICSLFIYLYLSLTSQPCRRHRTYWHPCSEGNGGRGALSALWPGEAQV